MPLPRIGVFPAAALQTHGRLFSGVGALAGVTFVPGHTPDPESYDGAVTVGMSRPEAIAIARSGLRSLAFLGSSSKPGSTGPGNVSLRQTSHLPTCLRGSTLPDRSVGRVFDVGPATTEEVIAQRGQEPLWIRLDQGGAALDLVAMPLPALPATEHLFSLFGETSWFVLLPLIHFVREIAGWAMPPSRACFMFDDPNLHWKSYGYVRYDELARDAALNNYHVSFATVPMDSWFVHRPTARLFREHGDRLSLLVHGNNHTHFELHRTSSAGARRALVAQALRRVARLERVSDVHVSKVMAAPHGACSEEMATDLLLGGFEAACISRGSLMSRNAGRVWPVSVGLHPAEFLGHGLPIMPRVGLSATSETHVRLALFLGQPVIPMGHHGDLHDGLEPLRRIAGLVNSIDQVRWTNMAAIASSNYLTRANQNVLHVRMYSRRIDLQVPSGVTELVIERPWLSDETVEELRVLGGSAVTPVVDASSPRELSVTVRPEDEVTISSCHPGAVDALAVPVERTTLRSIVRRQLCEARDRLRPTYEPLLRT